MNVLELAREGIEHFTVLVQENRNRKLVSIPTDVAEKLDLEKGDRIHIFIKLDLKNNDGKKIRRKA